MHVEGEGVVYHYDETQCQISVNRRANEHVHVTNDCQNGHIFGSVAFLIFLHNVTLFGIANIKKVTQCEQKKLLKEPSYLHKNGVFQAYKSL